MYIENKTGLICRSGDQKSISSNMRKLLKDKVLRNYLGITSKKEQKKNIREIRKS